jgi:hypothetical protein
MVRRRSGARLGRVDVARGSRTGERDVGPLAGGVVCNDEVGCVGRVALRGERVAGRTRGFTKLRGGGSLVGIATNFARVQRGMDRDDCSPAAPIPASRLCGADEIRPTANRRWRRWRHSRSRQLGSKYGKEGEETGD